MVRIARPTVPVQYSAADLTAGGNKLPNRAGRSGSTIHGWPAVTAGVLVTIVGLGLAALMLGLVAPGAVRVDKNMPPWIIALIGGLFAFVGMSVTIHGLLGVRRAARVRGLMAAHAAEPWRWDHPWDERVTRDDTAARARHFFVVGMFVLVFLTPFHYIGFFGPWMALPFGIVALLFDAVGVGLLVASGYFVARRLKYGPGRAWLAHFPFRRGGKLELHVEAPRTLPQHAVATATLRCVQERYVTSGTGEDRSTTVQCFEVYRDTAKVELTSIASGRLALQVTFDIPADAPTTDLASRPCRYWEVDVEAVTDGIDYGARFLVPVY